MRRTTWRVAALAAAVAGCSSNFETVTVERGGAIIIVKSFGPDGPLPAALVSIYEDYLVNCELRGNRAIRIPADSTGVLRLEATAPASTAPVCLSVRVEPPVGVPLQPSDRIPFSVPFKTADPFDSVTVNVTLRP